MKIRTVLESISRNTSRARHVGEQLVVDEATVTFRKGTVFGDTTLRSQQSMDTVSELWLRQTATYCAMKCVEGARTRKKCCRTKEAFTALVTNMSALLI